MPEPDPAPSAEQTTPPVPGDPNTPGPGVAPSPQQAPPAEPKDSAGDLDSIRAELELARRESATYQAQIRDLEPLAKAQRDAEDAAKTELERSNEQLAQLRGEHEQLQSLTTRLRLANTYGLDEDDLDLLGSGSPEEMEARAKRIQGYKATATTQSATPPPSDRQVEHLRPGASTPPRPTDPYTYPESWNPRPRTSS